MRQNASDLVRRAEAGERLTITVSGRPAAVLGPVGPNAWRRWEDVADVFGEPVDPQWAHDQDLVDGTMTDPWTPRAGQAGR
jgi:prevent-host-death family protein